MKTPKYSRKARPGLFSRVNYFLALSAVDFLILAVLFVGFHIYRRGGIPDFWPLHAFVLAFLFCSAAIFVAGGYSNRTDKLSLEYTTVHLTAFLLTLPLLLSVVYAFTAYTEATKPSRGVVIPGVAGLALLSLAIRRGVDLRLNRRRKDRYTAILGLPEDLRSLWHELLENPREKTLAYRLYGVGEAGSRKVAGDPSPEIRAWDPALLEHGSEQVEAVVMASHAGTLPPPLRKSLAQAHLDGLRVYTAEAFSEAVFRKVLLREVDDEWVLDRELALAQSASYARVKQGLDRFIALGLVLLFLPVMALTALAILLLDGRPVFYRQKRYGQKGVVFTLYKFRTMKKRVEEGSIYTEENDERITGLGKVLRPTRLDELPQLWNVLVGDMSLIGPRAEWVRCVERYEKEISYYHLRHEVPPGLTGWAQVNFPYGASVEDTREKLRYDLYYIRNHSFLLDFQIVLKTVYVVLAKAGGK
ncbi:MAG: exopolysaccharide biosynthesis polyprenyl glycosylphosphotransferase [Verrucomicrobia bacterium]|nr:exopolysaccharide biosynthesis polyprenyl glycosylphosphotransferase [Verrucomicrobiota bacterium]